jgi:hypothetical protein
VTNTDINYSIVWINAALKVAGGRLLHLMQKIKASKTERSNFDKIVKKKVRVFDWISL